MTAAGPPCLDDNLLAELATGVLDGARRSTAEAHLADCSACRAVLNALAHSSLAAPVPARAPPSLAQGEAVGRFTVLKPLGTGAMGTVYAAYDPQLDRTVALKLLHGAAGQQLLVIEARAMAKLASPHVVPVLDLGAHGDRQFIAMELVDGETLTRWLTAPRRALADTLRVLVEAGRGLAAAHAAGLTHGDFKPDNVLVGRDGRARVSDFGLASLEGGGRGGTPAYMAPEQLRGGPGGPRADQFSFCVVAWEALFGRKPFSAGQPPTLTALAAAVLKGQLDKPPSSARVPAKVRAALARGLSVDPLARFPSMEALLQALAPARRGVAPWVAVSALAVIAAVAVPLATREAPCREGPAKLAGLWDDARRAQVKQTFLATRLPYANAAWPTVERALDDYRDDWLRASVEACEATRVRGEQPEEVLELRTACLSQRLQELGAVVDLLATANQRVVENSAELVPERVSLSTCSLQPALLSPLKPPPALAGAASEVRGLLAQAEALELAGAYPESEKVARQALTRAGTVPYPAAEAEARLRLGLVQSALRQPAAEATLREAFDAAVAAHHEPAALRAAVEEVVVVIRDTSRAADAERWAQIARSWLARTPGNLRAEADLENNLGVMCRRTGRLEQAIEHHRAALALRQRVLGPTHLKVSSSTYNLGLVHLDLGRYPEALELFQASLELKLRALGEQHPQVARLRNAVGMALFRLGRPEAALEHQQQAVAMLERTEGESSAPEVALVLTNLGFTLEELERFDEALAAQRRALDLKQASASSDLMAIGRAHGNIGQVLGRQGHLEEALAELRAAVATLEKAAGSQHVDTAIARGQLGEVLLSAGHYAEAAALLAAVLPVLEAKQPRPDVLGRFRFELAQARWSEAGDRPQALALAAAARAELSTLPESPVRTRRLAAIDGWVAARSPGAPAKSSR